MTRLFQRASRRLLAGAGVIGLAIGFGAQTLVKDVITGIFILAEETISVGDVIDLEGNSGVVEDISIRTIRLRDMDGTVHMIPFSAVSKVKNMTRGFAHAVIDANVAYQEDVDTVIRTLQGLAGAEVLAFGLGQAVADRLQPGMQRVVTDARQQLVQLGGDLGRREIAAPGIGRFIEAADGRGRGLFWLAHVISVARGWPAVVIDLSGMAARPETGREAVSAGGGDRDGDVGSHGRGDIAAADIIAFQPEAQEKALLALDLGRLDHFAAETAIQA